MRPFKLFPWKRVARAEGAIVLDASSMDFADREKLSHLRDDLSAGVRNYLLFQRFSSYKWPYWIAGAYRKNPHFQSSLIPPFLLNRSLRDWLYFTNLFSRDAIRIDPAGMICPSGDAWSIEFWILSGSQLLRPQDGKGNVQQTRAGAGYSIRTVWRMKEFELRQELYGVKTSIDEAVAELEYVPAKKGHRISLLAAVRPYNCEYLGGAERIEFNAETGLIRINGNERVAVDAKPSFVWAGDGLRGDIAPRIDEEKTLRSACRFGMATLALGFELRGGAAPLHLRIALPSKKNIGPAKLNHSRLKAEYGEFAGLRIKSGFNLSFPDRRFVRWFYGLKSSMLNHVRSSVSPEAVTDPDLMRTAYYVAAACNRMGYFDESERLVSSLLGRFAVEKPVSVEKTIAAAYVLAAFADYFTHSREIDYVQKRHAQLQAAGRYLNAAAASVKPPLSGRARSKNTIDTYFLSGSHLYDAIFLTYSMRQCAYLARCIGLFGDEARLNGEIRRLGAMISKEISRTFPAAESAGAKGSETSHSHDEYSAYSVFAGFPFSLESLGPESRGAMLEGVGTLFDGLPLYVKSCGGWDSLLSSVYAANLLLGGKAACFEVMDAFMRLGEHRFALPEVIHPSDGRGVLGDGDSPVSASAFFNLMRIALFADSESGLRVLPLPREEWFAPGSEIQIQNAPSRFGALNIRIISSANEVQYRFLESPKFVPPEISINLPFKAKIKAENDFVIKKELGTSFVINGWPSMVRFLK